MGDLDWGLFWPQDLLVEDEKHAVLVDEDMIEPEVPTEIKMAATG